MLVPSTHSHNDGLTGATSYHETALYAQFYRKECSEAAWLREEVARYGRDGDGHAAAETYTNAKVKPA
jgi:hypothetical protein